MRATLLLLLQLRLPLRRLGVGAATTPRGVTGSRTGERHGHKPRQGWPVSKPGRRSDASAAHRKPFKLGANKTIVVPRGVTRLYLGFADANGFNGPAGAYDDNSGDLTVVVQPAS